jgi:hypothetical protein
MVIFLPGVQTGTSFTVDDERRPIDLLFEPKGTARLVLRRGILDVGPVFSEPAG